MVYQCIVFLVAAAEIGSVNMAEPETAEDTRRLREKWESAINGDCTVKGKIAGLNSEGGFSF